MSFRELRNFVEIMKALGYRRQLSLETFRTTNFSAMAECLHWLVTRYDPSADFAIDVSTEASRTQFLIHAVQAMSSRARIKLNPRHLYEAKGLAVREMLKIAQVLYDALMAYDNDENKTAAMPAVSLSKLDEMKAARTLATEIVESGSKLFSLLEKEDQFRKSRDSAIQFLDSMSLNLESNDPHDMIEKTVREEINTLSESVAELERTTASMETDREQLQSKIERKQTELDRTEQRLRSMKKVRPAFMDEYEQHETELKSVYEVYMERFRNLSYLESELSKLQEAEAEKKVEADKHLKKMRRRLRDEELRILRGEAVDDNADDPDAMRAAMAARASGIRSDRARRSDEITDEDEDGDENDNENEEDAEEEAEDEEEEEDEDVEEVPLGPSHPTRAGAGAGAGARTKPVGRVDFF